MSVLSWIKKKFESCGFSGDLDDEFIDEDYGFTPLSAKLGSYIPKAEFSRMRDGVIAVEFVEEGVVELYRVGVRLIAEDIGSRMSHIGIFPLNGGDFTRDVAKYNTDTYGVLWRAFHVDFPINARHLEAEQA